MIIPVVAIATIALMPIGLVGQALREPARVVVDVDGGLVLMDMRVGAARGSLWSAPSEVRGVLTSVAADSAFPVRDGVVALRHGTTSIRVSAASLKPLGVVAIGDALLLDPTVVPTEAGRPALISTRLVDGARALEWTWVGAPGLITIAGKVHAILGDPEDPPLIVAVSPEDEALARSLERDLGTLIRLFPEAARDEARRSLPSLLIATNWNDFDLAFHGAGRAAVTNVWVGPLNEDSPSRRRRLARLLAHGALQRRSPASAPSVQALAADAWSRLAVRVIGLESAPDARERDLEGLTYRAARVADWERYRDPNHVADDAIARMLQLLAPVAEDRLIDLLARRYPDATRCVALAEWLLDDSAPWDLQALIDIGTTRALAVANAEVQSIVQPESFDGEPRPGSTGWEFVGEHAGYLESCGCKGTKGGGVVDLVARWSQEPPPGVRRILLGNVLSVPDRTGHLEGANAVIAAAAKRMHLTAFVPGLLELSALATDGVERASLDALPLIACNVIDRSDDRCLPAYVDVEAEGGQRATRVIGVVRAGVRHSTPCLREPIEARFDLLDPVPEVLRWIASAPDGSDIVLAGDLVPGDLGRIAAATERRLLAISRESAVPRLLDGGILERYSTNGRIGGATIVVSSGGPYHLVTVTHDSADGWTTYRSELLANHEDDSAALSSFRRVIQELLESSQPDVELVFQEPLASPTRSYVGSKTCAQCHAAEHASWLETPHASAMRTLERVQRHRVRNCVACHVVGFGQASGYRFEAPDPVLRDVGCEVCHGPGSDHVRGLPDAVRRTPSNELCASCHTEQHSNFLLSDPASYHSRIDHRDARDAR